MGNRTLICADRIINICNELKVLLSDNGTFDPYKLMLLGKLQRLALEIRIDDEREDAKISDVLWISTDNGAHIPLKDGVAVGGPLEGSEFRDAYSKSKDSEKDKKHRSEKYESPIPLDKISAEGKNVRCKGFKSAGTAKYKVGKKHAADYGHMSYDEFESHAQDLLEKACDENIRGYKVADGSICRFNWQTGEYAKGYPGGHLRSCFYPRSKENKSGTVDVEYARAYFLRERDEEAYEG